MKKGNIFLLIALIAVVVIVAFFIYSYRINSPKQIVANETKFDLSCQTNVDCRLNPCFCMNKENNTQYQTPPDTDEIMCAYNLECQCKNNKCVGEIFK